ncbi:magnesium transporter [Meridianimarinicoccus roseus]|uniref:Magnesium transporter MgtE n=1 Tax=Meridianimarinicoccus roseus TaxID=2072018 RepID=A0A2V2LFE4_9RHOB|nr:magnesium transporter [Meridianimarinicoccus roseus]PWR03732.1 magnesium transporter [Meridianimarinicoccus roseus]
MLDEAAEDTDMTDTHLDPRRVGRILAAVETGDAGRLEEFLDGLHPADIADLLEQIDESEREAFLRLWAGDSVGEVLSELDEGLREDVISLLDPERLQAAVRDLDTDDVVDLVEDLEDVQKEAILDALEDVDRYAVEQALGYPEDTAGRLMQRDVVTAPEDWTVGQMIDFLRDNEDLPDQFYHVTLVDPRMVPLGNVTLGRMLSARRSVMLRDLTEETFIPIHATESGENVAYAFNQYHLISTPVVDDGGRLVGVITIDDAMIVLSDEHEEDILRLAGVGDASMSDNVMETVRVRLPWLAVNLGTAILASVVISQFENVLASVVALAVLMPIVASMGGNAGTQALTVAVRALATRDLTGSNMLRVVRREALVGLVNGVAFAVVMGVIGWAWFGSAVIGAVLGAAMIINLLVAGLSGILIPVVLERLKLDPALASGTFVTTVTDVVGFFAFLGLATQVLL